MATWKKLVQYNSGDTVTVATPTASTHAATKSYVDNLGLVWSRHNSNETLYPSEQEDKVGIGTDNATAPLHVKVGVNGDWVAKINNLHTTNGYGLYVAAGDDANVKSFCVADVNDNDKFYITGDGNATFAGAVTVSGNTTLNNHTLVDIGTDQSHGLMVSSSHTGYTNTQLYVVKYGQGASSNYDYFKIYNATTNTYPMKVSGDGNSTFAGRVDVVQSGDSILNVGSTGSGQADVVVDASNGDAQGGDYAFLSQYNDLSAAVGTASNAGNFLLKSKGSTAVTLNGTTATFAGNIIRDKITIDTDHILFSRNGSYAASRAWRWRVDDTAWGNFDLRRSNGADNTIDTSVLLFDGANSNATFAGNITTTGLVSSGTLSVGTTDNYQKITLWGGWMYIQAGYGFTWANGNATIEESSYSLLFKTYNSSGGLTTALTLDTNNAATFAGNITQTGGADRAILSQVSGDYFPRLQVERTGGSSKTNRKWSFDVGSNGSLFVEDKTAPRSVIELNTSGNATFAGNVGVAGAAGGHALTVTGEVKFNLSGSANMTINTVGGDAAYYMTDSDGTIQVNVDTEGDSYFKGGNVGIGTSTIPSRLTVQGISDYNLWIGRSDVGNASVIDSINNAQNSRQPLWLYGSPVKIGAGNLEVTGNATFEGLITGKTNASISSTTIGGDFSGAAFYTNGGDIVTGRMFFRGGSGAGDKLVGINNEGGSNDRLVVYNYTDSTYLMKLDYSGNATFTGNTNVSKLLKFTGDAVSSADFSIGKVQDGNEEYLNIKADSQKDVRIEGNLIVTGSIPNLGNTTFSADEPTVQIKHTGTAGDDESSLEYLDKNNRIHAKLHTILKDDSNSTWDSQFDIKTAVNGSVASRLLINESGNVQFAGNVGIGCAPSTGYPLMVQKADRYLISINNSNASNHWWLAMDDDGEFVLHCNGVGDRFTLLQNGNATFSGIINASYGSGNGFIRRNDNNGNTSMSVENHSTGTSHHAEIYIKDSVGNLTMGYSNNYSAGNWQGGWVYTTTGNLMLKGAADVEINAGGMADSDRQIIIDANTTNLYNRLSFAGNGTAADYSLYKASNDYLYLMGGTNGLSLKGKNSDDATIYLYNSDQKITFNTNNTERLKLENSGATFTGEITASKKVTITAEASAYGIHLNSGSSGSTAPFYISHGGGSHTGGAIKIYSANSGNLLTANASAGSGSFNIESLYNNGKPNIVSTGGATFSEKVKIADSTSSEKNFTIHRARFGGHDESIADILWNNYWTGTKWEGNSSSYKSTILRFDNAGMTYWVAPTSSGSPAHVEVFKVTNDTSYNRIYLGSYMALDMQGTALYVGSTTGQNKNTTLQLRANDAPALAFDSSRDGTFHGKVLVGSTASTDGTLNIKCHTNNWEGGIKFTSPDGNQTSIFHLDNDTTYQMMLNTNFYVGGKMGIGASPDASYSLVTAAKIYVGATGSYFNGTITVNSQGNSSNWYEAYNRTANLSHTSNSYTRFANWTEWGGTYGVYSPNTGFSGGSPHFYPGGCGDYGSYSVHGGKGGWGGISLFGKYVFMSNNSNEVGIYNDINNEWMIYCVQNGKVDLRYDGNTKFETTSGGATVHGSLKTTENVVFETNGSYIKHAHNKFQYNWQQSTTNSGSSGNFWVKIAEWQGISVTYAANNAHIIVRDGGDDQLSGYGEILVKIASNNSTHYTVGAHLIKHYGFAGISDVKVFRKSSYGNTDSSSTYEIWCKYGQGWVDQFSYEAHVSNGWGTFVPVTSNTATTTVPSGGDNNSNNGFTNELVNGTLYSKDLRLYGGGSLGIGKAPDASYPIDIESSSNVNVRLRATGANAGARIHMYSGASDSTYIGFNDENGTALSSIFTYGSSHGSAKELHFKTGGSTTAFTLDASQKAKFMGAIATNGQSPSSLYGVKTKTTGGDGSWGVYSTNNSSSGYQGGGGYFNADNVGMTIGYGIYVAASGASSKNYAMYADAGNVYVSNQLHVNGRIGIGVTNPTEMLVIGKDLGNMTTATGMVFGSDTHAHFFQGYSSTNFRQQTYSVSNTGLHRAYDYVKINSQGFYTCWAEVTDHGGSVGKKGYIRYGATTETDDAWDGIKPKMVQGGTTPGFQIAGSGIMLGNSSISYSDPENNSDYAFIYVKSGELYFRIGDGTEYKIAG